MLVLYTVSLPVLLCTCMYMYMCRIHYPLALAFAGKPDPRALQEIIRRLKQEVEVYQKQAAAATTMGSQSSHSSWSLAKLQKK